MLPSFYFCWNVEEKVTTYLKLYVGCKINCNVHKCRFVASKLKANAILADCSVPPRTGSLLAPSTYGLRETQNFF